MRAKISQKYYGAKFYITNTLDTYEGLTWKIQFMQIWLIGQHAKVGITWK